MDITVIKSILTKFYTGKILPDTLPLFRLAWKIDLETNFCRGDQLPREMPGESYLAKP